MSKSNCKKDEIIRENDGSINYKHYQDKARSIRSESIVSLFLGLFTDKKNSLKCNIENNQLLDFNHIDKQKEPSISLKKAA